NAPIFNRPQTCGVANHKDAMPGLQRYNDGYRTGEMVIPPLSLLHLVQSCFAKSSSQVEHRMFGLGPCKTQWIVFRSAQCLRNLVWSVDAAPYVVGSRLQCETNLVDKLFACTPVLRDHHRGNNDGYSGE